MELEKENINYLSLAQEILLFRGFMEWHNSPDKSLRKILKDVCKYEMHLYEEVDSKKLMEVCISCTLSNLLRQNFVTHYDFLRHHMDDKMTTKLKKMRDEFSKSKTNLNTTKLLDVLRQAFAHNDITMENPNWTLNNDFNIEINFKGHQFEFNFLELHDLLLEFSSLKNDSKFFTFGVAIKSITKAASNNKLNPNNISKFVTQYVDGTEDHIIPLDKYQKQSLYHLFYNDGVDVERNIHLLTTNKLHILSQCFPYPNSSGIIQKNNNLAIRQLIWLNKHFMSRDTFLDMCFGAEGEMTFIDSDKLWNSSEKQNYAIFIHENLVIT